MIFYRNIQRTRSLANNPKRQSLVGGGLERATLPFSGFQRAEHFCGYEVEEKSGQTSIELELGYKFWVDFSESFPSRVKNFSFLSVISNITF